MSRAGNAWLEICTCGLETLALFWLPWIYNQTHKVTPKSTRLQRASHSTHSTQIHTIIIIYRHTRTCVPDVHTHTHILAPPPSPSSYTNTGSMNSIPQSPTSTGASGESIAIEEGMKSKLSRPVLCLEGRVSHTKPSLTLSTLFIGGSLGEA